MENYLNSALGDVKRSLIRVFNKNAKEKEGCISLTLGEPDFKTPLPICERAKQSIDEGETHYIENNGNSALRQAIAEFENQRNGSDYTSDEVIVTVGATEGLFTSLFGILNPEDEVIVPTPAFGLYESIITLCRGKFVPVDTSENGFQLSEEMINGAITEKTKAIILNSPNNPTGCILNENSLMNIYNAVKGKNIFVICDEVYNQLVYTENIKSFVSFQNLRKQIIVVQSYSKPYAMTGWRMGYIMADFSVKSRIELVHQYTVVSTASISQKACIEALKCDVTEMRRIYKKRRDYVYSRLNQMGLETIKPEGAFYAFPSIKKFGMTSTEFCERLIDEALLAVTPGICFGSDDHIRLTYCYSDSELAEGLDRLEKFIKALESEEK